MRKYQLVIVIKPEAKEAELQADIKTSVEASGGKVLGTEPMPQKKLAYPVQGFREGNFHSVSFEGPSEVTANLNEKLRVHAEVLRYMIRSTTPLKELKVKEK